MVNQFDEQMSFMTDEQLEEVIENEVEYQVEAVMAAKNEVKLREKISKHVSSGNLGGISDTELLNCRTKSDILPSSIIASLNEEVKVRKLILQRSDDIDNSDEYSDNSTFSSWLNIFGIISYILGIAGAIYLIVNLPKSGPYGEFDDDKLPQALIISAIFLFYNVLFGLICHGISKLLNR